MRAEPGWQILMETGEVKLWSASYGNFPALTSQTYSLGKNETLPSSEAGLSWNWWNTHQFSCVVFPIYCISTWSLTIIWEIEKSRKTRILCAESTSVKSLVNFLSVFSSVHFKTRTMLYCKLCFVLFKFMMTKIFISPSHMSYLDEQPPSGPTSLNQTPGGNCDSDFFLCPKPVNPWVLSG